MRSPEIRELLDSLGPALRLFAAQWCRSPDDAVQEAFIDLVDTSTWPGNPTAWLYAVTRNKAKNIGRTDQRRENRQQTVAEESGTAWFDSSTESNPFDAAEITAALDGLNPIERQIVVARIWGELKFEDMAELIGRSTSAVHRCYHTAIEKLRLQLEVENATDR